MRWVWVACLSVVLFVGGCNEALDGGIIPPTSTTTVPLGLCGGARDTDGDGVWDTLWTSEFDELHRLLQRQIDSMHPVPPPPGDWDDELVNVGGDWYAEGPDGVVDFVSTFEYFQDTRHRTLQTFSDLLADPPSSYTVLECDYREDGKRSECRDPVDMRLFVYHYDESGFLVLYEYFTGVDFDPLLYERTEFENDDDGFPLRTTTFNTSGNVKEICEQLPDDQGRISFRSCGLTLDEPSFVVTWEYYENGVPSVVETTRPDGRLNRFENTPEGRPSRTTLSINGEIMDDRVFLYEWGRSRLSLTIDEGADGTPDEFGLEAYDCLDLPLSDTPPPNLER